jgi:hypothetical protein
VCALAGYVGYDFNHYNRDWGFPEFLRHSKLYKSQAGFVVNDKLTVSVSFDNQWFGTEQAGFTLRYHGGDSTVYGALEKKLRDYACKKVNCRRQVQPDEPIRPTKVPQVSQTTKVSPAPMVSSDPFRLYLVHWANTPRASFKVICDAFAAVVTDDERISIEILLARIKAVVTGTSAAQKAVVQKAARQQLYVELKVPDRKTAEQITGAKGWPGVWKWLYEPE